MTSFPPGFVWGAATAAHQVEGNNVNSDLWVLEHCSPTLFAEPSLDACDRLWSNASMASKFLQGSASTRTPVREARQRH